MTKLLTALSLLLLFGSTGSAQELSTEDRRRLRKIAFVVPVEAKSPPLIWRATLAGREIPIDKISRSPDSALRIVVIDQRTVTDPEDLPSADLYPAEFRAGRGREIQPPGVWIRVDQTKPAENSGRRRADALWRHFSAPDYETARRLAESVFAGARPDDRQALLVIGGQPESAGHLGGDAKIYATEEVISEEAAIPNRLVTIIAPVPAAGAGSSAPPSLENRIRRWFGSLPGFVVISVVIPAAPAIVARQVLRVEAADKNKVVASRSRTIDFSGGANEEIESAFADYSRIVNFENLSKYPGLSAADFRYFREHYAPPIEGVVINTDRAKNERLRKLSDPVFRLHGVAGQCDVVLLESRLPTVFTWKLAFVSVTTKDLEIFSDAELSALIAHEVGHLYFTAELLEARQTGDERVARIAELKCDLIALETLHRLGIEESVLGAALEKLLSARRSVQVKSFKEGSPPSEDRRRLVEKYLSAAHQIQGH